MLAAGSLADTSGGHAAYLDFLAWLHDDEPAQKAYAFDCMCKGWAMGSKEFKGALIEEHKQALAQLEAGESDLAEVAARQADNAVDACLKRLGRSADEAVKQPQVAAWKVAIAAHLRTISTVKNPGLAGKLHMGDPDGVSRYVSEMRQGKRPAAAILQQIADIRV